MCMEKKIDEHIRFYKKNFIMLFIPLDMGV